MHTTSRFSIHDPDGVPHEIVGLTWALTLGVAICAFAALTFGGAVSGLALFAIPILVVVLAQRAGARRGAARRVR